jgi:DNA-directed RNA polymerase specialized sigma24 family protein
MPAFPTTRWSVVCAAAGDGAEARASLAWLCDRYWECLRMHARRRGFSIEDAEDLTQEFLLSVVRGEVVERADRQRGRFRTFLLACLDHQLGHARERRAAAKRGGGVHAEQLPPDGPPVAVDPSLGFDQDWARQVVARARDRLRASEPPERLARLEPFLSTNGDADSYAAAGRELGMHEGAVKVAVHRLRARFREALRLEVADTLAEPDPTLVDEELRHLRQAIGEMGVTGTRGPVSMG